MNLVILIGNIGQDVELTSFENGGQIARTTLATNESYTNREGQMVDVTEWHNLEVSNKLADVFQKHVKKGDKIRVSGKLKTQSYDKYVSCAKAINQMAAEGNQQCYRQCIRNDRRLHI